MKIYRISEDGIIDTNSGIVLENGDKIFPKNISSNEPSSTSINIKINAKDKAILSFLKQHFKPKKTFLKTKKYRRYKKKFILKVKKNALRPEHKKDKFLKSISKLTINSLLEVAKARIVGCHGKRIFSDLEKKREFCFVAPNNLRKFIGNIDGISNSSKNH